jgi:CspA family cold shock protein
VLKLLKKLFSSNKETSQKGTAQKEGVVKFFSYSKGFGFITFKDSDKEIFVHKTNLKSRIKQGNRVTFTIGQSKKGPTAMNVKKIVK